MDKLSKDNHLIRFVTIGHLVVMIMMIHDFLDNNDDDHNDEDNNDNHLRRFVTISHLVIQI